MEAFQAPAVAACTSRSHNARTESATCSPQHGRRRASAARTRFAGDARRFYGGVSERNALVCQPARRAAAAVLPSGARADAGAATVRSAPASERAALEFACPDCRVPLVSRKSLSKSWRERRLGEFYCESCARTFADLDGITDFSRTKQKIASETLFESPVVASIYETPIWRLRGRPPFELEYGFARRSLMPVRDGLILDVSCGPGQMGRRLMQSGQFARVYGVDASEAMLREAMRKREAGAIDGYPLLRADVERLPFADASVAGLYAGAAIHCWPDVPAAFAEMARVLRPGGRLVASTFTVIVDVPLVRAAVGALEDGSRTALKAFEEGVLPAFGGTGLPALPLLANALEALSSLGGGAGGGGEGEAPLPLRRVMVEAEKRQFTFGRRDSSGAPLFGCYEVEELRRYCEAAGLEGFEAETFPGYTVFRAQKPVALAPAPEEAEPAPAADATLS
eukprot:tig00021493_g21872.t1